MNYEKLGLKCGIEIHQQLDTCKLFCSCGTSMQQEPRDQITRKLRAVVGELGEVDPAVAQESMKNKSFLYKSYEGESCLVEADEEPPHDLNSHALDIAVTMAGMLNCSVPDEIHVMRKTVIDGSNTTGFQRTALVGLDGKLATEEGSIGITNVCLEEDAAQILDRKGDSTTYGLDRLGIPLVEIGTDPDIRTPEQARDAAQKIGMMLRSTGRVKRGLGTIRQDINISIRGGARVEIKGAQELNMIPTMVEHEIQRQQKLIELRKQLKPLKAEVHDATHIFSKSESKITGGKNVYATVANGLNGKFRTMLNPTKTLGNEIAAYVRVRTGTKGFIHSDEDLEKYGLTKEFDRLRKELKAGSGDALIIVSGDKKTSILVAEAIAERIGQFLDGVPAETRKALPDGSSEYLRPLPGAARMYPETDTLPIHISAKYLRGVMSSLPETWDRMIERFVKQYKINHELSTQVVKSGLGGIFEEIARLDVDAKLVATTITQGLRDLKAREAVPIENIRDDHILRTFEAFKAGKLQKQNILDVLRECARKPDKDIKRLIDSFSSDGMGEEGVRKIVREIISQKPGILKKDRPEKVYMGLVMVKVRGKAPGDVVMKVLQEEIKKRK